MRNLARIGKYTSFGVLILALLYTAYIYVVYPGFLTYGWQQAKGQLTILFHTTPVSEALKNPDFTVEQKEKLLLVNDIKEFTVIDLGFDPTKSYTEVYNQKGKPLLWVLTACPPFELKPIQWNYPILGKLEYKGFFKRELADKALLEAEKNGWDVSLDEVNAWSTLGVLNDPILSSFLNLSEGRLASLIIHELTHSHVYLPESVSFNENFASFVGRRGALLFLKKHFGVNSQELIEYKQRLEDFEQFKEHMIASAQILESHYASTSRLDSSEATIQKRTLIDKLIISLDTLPFHKKRFDHLIKDPSQINNTFFTDFLLYNSSQNDFEEDLENKYGGNLKEFIAGTLAEFEN